MENVYIKSQLKKVKKYYDSIRWMLANKVVGEPYMEEDFYQFIKKLNDIILLAPIDYLLIYSGLYCQGKTYDELVKRFGYCRKTLYNINKELEKYLEKRVNNM